jgi:hypothetical protein
MLAQEKNGLFKQETEFFFFTMAILLEHDHWRLSLDKVCVPLLS